MKQNSGNDNSPSRLPLMWNNLSRIIRTVAQQVGPSVVRISTLADSGYYPADPRFSLLDGRGSFSGIIFNSYGYILTTERAIRNAKSIRVELPDGRIFLAGLLGSDESSNIAVLKIVGNDLPYTRISKKHPTRKGDVVLALGNQFGSDWTVSTGVISGFHKKLVTRHRRILRNLIQTDVTINPSNIGGPLINQYGEIIGINAFSLKGIGFVSHITVASKTIDEIVLGHNNFLSVLGIETMDVFIEQVQRIWFGIANKSGVKIIELNKKGLASQCGLKPFDIIVGVNSVIIEELADLRNCFVSLNKSLSIINELQFHILRKNRFMQVRVVLSGTENN